MPVVPFIPAIVGAGASLIGANKQANAASQAGDQQYAAALAGIESQEKMFDKSLELQQPYRQQGYAALRGLNDLTNPEKRGAMLDSYYNSNEYRNMQDQARASTLAGQSATGGLRSGASHAALEQIAPALGQQYLTNRYNDLTGLANMGMGAASQGAKGALSTGSNIGNLLAQGGAAQAGSTLGQANAFNSGLQGLAGAFGQGWGVAQEKGYI